MAEEEQHISTDDVRGGETGTGLRWMLGGGLALIVVIFAVLLLVWR